MGKLEEMMRGAGTNVGESMGAGRQSPSVHRATAPAFGGVPARLQGVLKAKDTAEIPVDRIQPDPDQPREEFDETALDHLAESLKTRGQLQPIRVRWDEGQGTYVVVAGERRWRAAVRAELKTMTCVIQDGVLAPGEMLAIQLVENLIREDLKPIEQAKAYRSLMELNGWSARQVARELAIDHTGVTRALALLELPAAVQAQVEEGALPPATAYEVSKLEDPEQQREVAALVVQDGLSRAETVERVRQVAKAPKKGRGVAKAGPPRPRTFRVGGGKVVLEPKKVGAEAMLAMVEEVAAMLRAELEPKEQEAA
ncbi:ParB/RepB/Spo0J family partition protein [Singulisphaera acidiphila]|uniref:ParB-like partition protein n=1 Tax=Singulisphaera acidiphila (strain ATCC BAA-1392 / DSM 18658 / VKM B-2454 / MOB10) TaxID=886293 RepID=L0DRM7_SINAD|nr:ParB/RepB/Spo0J family partition protein [Singulisphaera acidiphila]AGA31650.1 ParB-like partition protein [Singulisphaera acidiphila DSM 18658]